MVNLPTVQSVKYLGSTIDRGGVASKDVVEMERAEWSDWRQESSNEMERAEWSDWRQESSQRNGES